MIYQLSNIHLNTKSQMLSIDGKTVDADERLIILLTELITHYPEHCSKQLLIARIWPDRVVSEWSISRLVSDLRQLVKNNGFDGKLIQTLHGRGYRLQPTLGDTICIVDAPQTSIPSRSTLINNKRHLFIPLTLFCLSVILVWRLNIFRVDNGIVVSEPPDSSGRLLWVDDHPENNQQEKRYFEQHNITVYQVNSTQEALTSLTLYDYKAVISDMGRGDEVLAGLNLLTSMRDNGDQTPFILYTIVLTDAQQNLIHQKHGQGVAVEQAKLYELVLPYFD